MFKKVLLLSTLITISLGYCGTNSSEDNNDTMVIENIDSDDNNEVGSNLKNKANNSQDNNKIGEKNKVSNSQDNNKTSNKNKDNNKSLGKDRNGNGKSEIESSKGNNDNISELYNSEEYPETAVNSEVNDNNTEYNNGGVSSHTEINSNKNKKGRINMESNKFNRNLFENAEKLDTSSNEIQKDIEQHKIQVISEKTKFDNDLWIVKKDGSKSIAFTIRFKYEGKRSFKDNYEMIGLVLNTMFEGTKTKTGEQIKELIENKSLEIECHADYDDITINVSCLSKYFNDVIDLLCDLFTNATFPEGKVKESKEKLILQLKQAKFNPHKLAYEKICTIVFPEEYQCSIDKSIKNTEGYNSKTIINNCYNKIFRPDNAVITIAGDIIDDADKSGEKYKDNKSVVLKSTIVNGFNKLHDALLNKVNKYGSKVSPFNPGEQKTELSISDEYKNKKQINEHVLLDNPQSVILFALPGVALTDEDKFAIRAAEVIFGGGSFSSRLIDNLRLQNGLVYWSCTRLYNYDLQSCLLGISLVKSENVNRVIDEIRKQVNNIYENGITEEELRNFKINRYAKNNFPSIESLLSLVTSIRDDEAKIEEVNDYISKYLNLDIKDINRALKKVFDPKKIVFVNCGRDPKAIKSNENNKQIQPTLSQEKVDKFPEDKNKKKEENNKLEGVVCDKNNQLNIQEKVLENGLRVIVVPLNTPNSISYGVGYFVGSADDPRNLRGCSHFLEHMMFGLTKHLKKGEIHKYLDKYSRYNNAYTGFDMTFYDNQCNRAFLELFLQIEAERMINIKFDDKEIENERGAILEERNMRIDSDPYTRYIQEEVLKALYLYSPYSEEIMGYTDQIKACNAKNLKAHYDLYYMPNNAFALFVGDITLDKAFELCQKYFGHIKRGPEIKRNRVMEPEKTGITKRITHKSDQISKTYLAMFYKIPRKKLDTLKKLITMSIANNILAGGESSILYKKLVENKKLLHSISWHKWLISKYDTSIVSLSANLQEGKNIKEVEKELNKLIEEFPNKLLTEKLFEIEKQKMIDNIDLMLENQRELSTYIIWNVFGHGYSLEEFKNIKNIIKSIKYEDVKATAKDILSTDNKVVVLEEMPDKKAQEAQKKKDNKNKKQAVSGKDKVVTNKNAVGNDNVVASKNKQNKEGIKGIIKDIAGKAKDNLETLKDKTKDKVEQVKDKFKEIKNNKKGNKNEPN